MKAVRKRSPKHAFRSAKTSLRNSEQYCGLVPLGANPTFASTLESLQKPWSLFTEYVSYCQLAIRHDLADCKPQLKLAVDLSVRAAKRWKDAQRLESKPTAHKTVIHFDTNGNETEETIYRTYPKRIDHVDFNFSLAALISLMTRKDVPNSIRMVVPSVPGWHPDHTSLEGLSETALVTEIPSNYCDSGLLYMINHCRRPKNWASIIAILDQRACLLRQTYDAYGEIILSSAKEEWGNAWEAVESAHDLYEQRGRHYYNEFFAWEGEASSNDLYADIRLSALIHRCIPSRRIPKNSPAIIHRLKRSK